MSLKNTNPNNNFPISTESLAHLKTNPFKSMHYICDGYISLVAFNEVSYRGTIPERREYKP